jgi:hypothetical protein
VKLFELLIDENDDFSGVEFLSIVKNPANEVKFEIFNDQTQHNCAVENDLPDELLKHFEEFGEQLNPDLLIGAKIGPAKLVLTAQDFAAPPITSDPKKFDIFSGDQQDGEVITRYIYGVDTGLGAPLISTSREMCRKLLVAQRVFSRQDIINLSNKLTSASDSFKLVPRAQMNSQVDAFEYKMGALCRHRWFQIEFAVPQDLTYDQALAKIPVKAQAAIGVGKNVGGAGRPFQAEAKIVPPSQLNRRPAGFSASDDLEPVNFHMGLFMYKTRKAALLAEPTAKAITRVKINACGYDYGCSGYMPAEVYGQYFEGSAEVLETFKVRQSFVKVPDYIREVAQQAVNYAEENGWGDCGTDVGKRRANDLADPTYDASLDILTRMYSYGSRHKVDWESSKDFEDGCGSLMMAAWGLSRSNYDAAMKFLEGEIEKATKDNVAFSKNELKGDITAVVFQPDQKIYRYDPESNTSYYVFMSRDTIRKMLMKLSKLKPKNLINIEHTDKVFPGNEVYSYENWLVGDDPMMDKSYEIFGRDFPSGTWITTIHFANNEHFENFVLSNETAGISLQGLFEEVPFNFMNFAEVGPRGGIKESEKAPKSDTPNTSPEGENTAGGDASGKRGAKVSAEQEKTLQKKVDDFNEKESNTKNGNATLGALKSVFQRGLGAYNTSHSPAVKSAEQWAYARVNAFLYLLKNGRPENKKYITDYDLLPNKHPKNMEASAMDYPSELDVFGYQTEYFFICPRAVELFEHLMEMNPPEDEQGMIRSLALQADAIFQIEHEALSRGKATSQDLQQAILLVDDFTDLLGEIDHLLGMEHDPSFMLDHIEVIAGLTEDFADYPWEECISDMTERYGANSAPKICGKIKAENMKKTEMSKEDYDAAIRVFLLEELINKLDR